MSQLIYNDLKKIVSEVENAKTPTNTLEGTIVSLNPFKVEIDGNSEFYPSSAFVVPQYLRDRTVNVEYNDGVTALAGPLTIHNGLQVGDVVLILQSQEGQKLIILDRL